MFNKLADSRTLEYMGRLHWHYSNIMQYLNLATLKSKSILVDNLLQENEDFENIETGMAEKSSWD